MAAVAVRRAPYKDVLQPALQRRFSLTAAILLSVSYVLAVLTGEWSSFLWSWFPIGPAGFRTLCIFGCGLAILVLRIAHYHVGRRTLTPGAKVVASSLSTLSTYETLFWYGFSSMSFGTIALWSMPENAKLQWIAYLHGGRARINERPIFFMAYMLTLAILQTWAHYAQDLDRLELRFRKAKADKENEKEGHKTTGDAARSMLAVFQEVPTLLNDTIIRAIYALPTTFVLYHLVFRGLAWSWALLFFRPFYNLPKTNMVPPTWPADLYLFGRCMYNGILVSTLWAVGNAAFSASMAKEPIKNGKALTSESTDPNGSLLNGLKSKKETVKAFATWELAQIAEDDSTRRQAIYQDIDRKNGPMWSQVYGICMEVLKSIDARIEEFDKPATPAAMDTPAEPRQRSTAPLHDDPIFSKRESSASFAGGVRKAIDQVAHSPGSSPAKHLSPLAKKSWDEAKSRLLSKEQQEQISPANVKSQFEQLTNQLVAFPWVGDFVREDFAPRFSAIVLGAPFANPSVYLHASQALCHLAVHSLGEDQYGNVHRDVPSIIRTLTSLIRKIEALKARFPIHWSDKTGNKKCDDVTLVVSGLRSGLSLVVAAFEPFSTDLRLTPGDLRHAKEAAVEPEPEPASELKTRSQDKPQLKRGTSGDVGDRKEPRPERRRLQPRDSAVEMEQVRASGRATRI